MFDFFALPLPQSFHYQALPFLPRCEWKLCTTAAHSQSAISLIYFSSVLRKATFAAADLTRTVNYVIDSGSLPMQTGDKGKLTIDVTGVIENIRVLADQTGDIVLDIGKASFADYPNFNSITAGQRVQLTNTNKYFDDVLNNWTTTIGAGDILRFTVVSVNNIRRLLISLKLKL